ncbi:MAG: protein kinase domain-containing protein [Planctomycetota bacterium]|jgi:non-specific serine/threonine protein kinase
MATTDNNNRENSFEEAVRQFLDAQLRGMAPDIEELVRRYPEFEDQIRQKIKEFQKVDSLFDTLVQADESDFEDTATGQEFVGQKIGSFEIVEMIGRGGMGVVYLARDTKLKRSVAVKRMPVELQADSTARTRFRREAELLASLNHPNIAAIYDIIEQDAGAGYLILEYVPGETLAERIAKKPLKLEEALSIALQIAEAVSAAHENGVVHRDLKPGNIKITPEGKVKVLDFGLAKAVSREPSERDTAVTQPGRVIGTPAYMSPEQARGKSTDHRTDIWSFGCIMYEMLTGHLPFEGETATDTLARIIERQPDWEMLPQKTPANVRVLLRRCLKKDPSRRLRDIGDAAIEISETLSKPATAPSAKLRRIAMIIGAVAIGIILSGIALKFIPKKETQPSPKEIRLVVLPFENLGPAEDEYFAAGITDAITARLAGIQGLGVISRQSAIQYKAREKSPPQIGKELRVNYILEGTVQRERPSDPTSRVRIIPQLVKISDNTHVWSDIYDDDMSEIFRVQSDLAERVAQALDITLLEPERRALASKPTQNVEAYEYYLRGNEYFQRSYLENDFGIAIQMYKKAVELDPTFALAYAQLSRAHVFMYFKHYDHSDARLAMAKQAVNKVFQFNPELPEAHLALGHYYYHGHLDYDRALEQFAIARKRQPNNSEVMTFIGYVQRRQGKFKKAIVTLKEAFELDPRSAPLAFNIGQVFVLLRKYPEAEHYCDRAISLTPDLPQPYAWKVQLYLLWEGKTEKARVVLEKVQEALAQLSSCKLEVFDTQIYFVPKAQLYGQINGLMGNRQLEHAYYESARNILKTKVQEQPDDARFHSSLGIVYAGLGCKEDAVREGKLGVELLPVTKEAWGSLYRVQALAKIYVMVGEFDAAIDQLEFLLSIPSEVSIPLLRLDPTWAPLCDHPRFKKLVEAGK